jgi:flagellar motor switch/type III secretory pathway protein FliN
VDDTNLDQTELDAIRGAMRESAPASRRAQTEARATPVALISDDHHAEKARPAGLKLAARWAKACEKQLGRLAGGRVSVLVAGAEALDGLTARDRLASSWTSAIGDLHGQALGMVAVSGSIIEAVAARLLGDRSAPPETNRPPSSIAMTLFNQAGRSLVAALVDAWRDEQARKVTPLGPGEPADAWRRAIGDEENVILVTLQIDAPSGLILLVARPADLAPRAPQLPHVDSERNKVLAALAEVPIEIQVELGRTKLSVAALAALKIGETLTLDRFIDDPLPISVAGVVKAQGRALVSRGALAVEVAGANDSNDSKGKR